MQQTKSEKSLAGSKRLKRALVLVVVGCVVAGLIAVAMVLKVWRESTAIVGFSECAVALGQGSSTRACDELSPGELERARAHAQCLTRREEASARGEDPDTACRLVIVPVASALKAATPSRRTTDEPPKMGKPLFSCGYANFAWGSVAYGHVLDDQGKTWFYDLGRTWSPEPAGDDLYGEAALRARFARPRLESRQVPAARLDAMRKLAEIAKDGRIEKEQTAYDAGGSGCEAYIWERPDAYREVELGSRGDFSIRNTTPEADQLTRALREEIFNGLPSKSSKE